MPMSHVASLDTLWHRGAPMSSHPVLGKCTWPLARKVIIWCVHSSTNPTNMCDASAYTIVDFVAAYTIDWYKVGAGASHHSWALIGSPALSAYLYKLTG